jgi:uncharacterized protein DUF3592
MKGCSVSLTLVFVVLGILALALGLLNYSQEKAIFATYQPATATLTDWVPDPNYGTADYCPVFEFTTKDGKTRSYTGDNCERKPDPSTIGKQQEQIYYDPENPYSPIETKGWTGSEGTGLILGTVFFVFFEGMALFFYFMPLLEKLFQGAKAGHQPALTTNQGSQWEAGRAQEQLRENLESASAKLTEARIALAKIEELKALRDANQISEADYQKRKQEIKSKMPH